MTGVFFLGGFVLCVLFVLFTWRDISYDMKRVEKEREEKAKKQKQWDEEKAKCVCGNCGRSIYNDDHTMYGLCRECQQILRDEKSFDTIMDGEYQIGYRDCTIFAKLFKKKFGSTEQVGRYTTVKIDHVWQMPNAENYWTEFKSIERDCANNDIPKKVAAKKVDQFFAEWKEDFEKKNNHNREWRDKENAEEQRRVKVGNYLLEHVENSND